MTNGKHEAATEAARGSEAMPPRIEIVADRRRAHTAEFRASVVAESLVPGVRVQDVAERRGVCPSLIYRWRRTAGADAAGGDGGVRLFP
ncbi:MAG: transposase, partial [Acetobacteraceae bacterium]